MRASGRLACAFAVLAGCQEAPGPAGGMGAEAGAGGRPEAGGASGEGGRLGRGGAGGVARNGGTHGLAGMFGSGGALAPDGGSDGAPPGDGAAPADGALAADAAPPPEGKAVTGFDGAHVYFLGMDNRRTVDAEVVFPAAAESFERITLELGLRCPQNRCDFWDRWAYLGLVEGAGMMEQVTEIARFVTPYRVAGRWTLDVTSLRPLLTGNRRLRVFIDTWVGPGHAQGNGWLVDAIFYFKPGQPARVATAVIPLWNVSNVEVGDPAKPVATARPPRKVTIPADAGQVELRTLVTGHGQGNKENCAEFCPKTHTYDVGGMAFSRRIWRDDCATSAVPNQLGTYKYPRAGWCPGALADPWVIDVSVPAQPGRMVTITYAPEPYENTCREGANPCVGCAFSGGCMYNDAHTAPNYAHSALLIVYRK